MKKKPKAGIFERLPGDGLLIASALLVISGFAWSALTELEEVASGAGQVVPKETIRKVQHAEGGVVTKVHVEPGSLVQKGEPLVTLTNSDIAKELQQAVTRLPQLQVRIARLEAEANGAETIAWPPETPQNRDTLAAEREQAYRRHSQLRDLTERGRQTLAARLADLEGARGRYAASQQELALATEALTSKRAGATGELRVVGRQEVILAEKEVARLRTQLAGIVADAQRFAKQVEEAKAANSEAERRWRSDAGQELLSARAERDQLQEKYRIVAGQMERTQVLAPITGRVKAVDISEQSVVAGGQPMLEIVPTETGIQIETWVSPRDVRGLVPGQPAIVRLTACDSTRYGSFKGQIEAISPDSFRQPEAGARTTSAVSRQQPGHFQVLVQIEKDVCGFGPGAFRIQAGMTAETDFITGSRTVLSYLTTPLERAVERAGRER